MFHGSLFQLCLFFFYSSFLLNFKFSFMFICRFQICIFFSLMSLFNFEVISFHDQFLLK